MQYDYSRTNSNNSLQNVHYPGAFFYEYYRFKYLIYAKFIKKEILSAISNEPNRQQQHATKQRLGVRRWTTLRLLLQGSPRKANNLTVGVFSNAVHSGVEAGGGFNVRSWDEYVKNNLIKSPYATILGRLGYVRNKITSKLKSTSGVVAYKRPYRIPVELVDPKTDKDIMFDTRSAWYRFIYLTDYFDEAEDGDAKVQEYRQYGRSDASLRFKRNWFFSNYKLEDRELMLVRGGS